ncbi:LysR family transcriptional regulator [candidate division KSB1 bacterium]|nr:MAG: LysR family transcriptional regulator [candidate division KSB1 bacterium]
MKYYKVNFDLKQLDIFCKIVELNSFSRAAEEVKLTQPTVSERIASLEMVFDTQLLDRGSKKIMPTKAGKILYYYAKRILNIKSELIQKMNKFLEIEKGDLTIGGSSIPGTHIMPELIGKFRSFHPGINIVLKLGDSQEIIDGVNSGIYELGVVGKKPENYKIACLDFREDSLILVVNNNHPWAEIDTGISLSLILKEPFIMREEGSGTRKIIENVLLHNDINPDNLNVVCELGSSEAVKKGIMANIGISIISRREVETELQLGILKEVKIDSIKFDRKFFLIYHKNRPRSPICKTFLDFVLDTK